MLRGDWIELVLVVLYFSLCLIKIWVCNVFLVIAMWREICFGIFGKEFFIF